MAKANLVQKQVLLGLNDIIKFQLLNYCNLYNKSVSDADLNCLTLLGLIGEVELSEFCLYAYKQNIFKSTQTVRNCLMRMEKENLIIKKGPGKKRVIVINPDLNIQTKGNIVLMYKIIHIDTTKS